jgi:hypothetical protein
MKARCTNPNNHKYANYGGRGITVSPTWRVYHQFIADMGARPTAKHTLERIDNNGNYCKENCRWATHIEQANNRRVRKTARYLTARGETKTLVDWARHVSIPAITISGRLRRGWSVDAAIFTVPSKIKNWRNQWHNQPPP